MFYGPSSGGHGGSHRDKGTAGCFGKVLCQARCWKDQEHKVQLKVNAGVSERGPGEGFKMRGHSRPRKNPDEWKGSVQTLLRHGDRQVPVVGIESW